MKYLNALLRTEEIPRHSRKEEPTKPIKPVSSVLSGGYGKSTGEIEQVSAPQPPKSSKSSESSRPPRGEVNFRLFYRQMAELVSGDCWAINPTWLLDHPEPWEQIRDLDEQLTTMERAGASELEYRTTLARLVVRIRDARAEKQIELQARLLGELKDTATVNVLVLPEWHHIRTLVLEALGPYPQARISVAEALGRLTNGHGA